MSTLATIYSRQCGQGLGVDPAMVQGSGPSQKGSMGDSKGGEGQAGKGKTWEGMAEECSSKSFSKKPWSWTLANFETDRRPWFNFKQLYLYSYME